MAHHPRKNWNLGLTLLFATPFVGLAVNFLDLPLWVDIASLIAMIALIFFGVRLIFAKRGGWRPSDTLPKE